MVCQRACLPVLSHVLLLLINYRQRNKYVPVSEIDKSFVVEGLFFSLSFSVPPRCVYFRFFRRLCRKRCAVFRFENGCVFFPQQRVVIFVNGYVSSKDCVGKDVQAVPFWRRFFSLSIRLMLGRVFLRYTSCSHNPVSLCNRSREMYSPIRRKTRKQCYYYCYCLLVFRRIGEYIPLALF